MKTVSERVWRHWVCVYSTEPPFIVLAPPSPLNILWSSNLFLVWCHSLFCRLGKEGWKRLSDFLRVDSVVRWWGNAGMAHPQPVSWSWKLCLLLWGQGCPLVHCVIQPAPRASSEGIWLLLLEAVPLHGCLRILTVDPRLEACIITLLVYSHK